MLLAASFCEGKLLDEFAKGVSRKPYPRRGIGRAGRRESRPCPGVVWWVPIRPPRERGCRMPDDRTAMPTESTDRPRPQKQRPAPRDSDPGIRVVPKHHALVRLTHWANVPLLLGLIATGLA